MKKAATWALLLTALLPLVVGEHLVLSPYVLAKTEYIRGLSFIAVFLTTLALFFDKKEVQNDIIQKTRAVFRNPICIALALNIIFLIFSTLFAYDRTAAFFGETVRGEGFLTLFAFFCTGVSMAILFAKREWNIFFTLFSISAVIVVGIEIWQKSIGLGRPESLFGNPAFLAGALIFPIFSGSYLFYQGLKEKNKILLYFGPLVGLLSVVGIFITETRGTIVALIAGLLAVTIASVVLGKNIRLGKKTLRYFASIVLACGIVLGGGFLATRHATFWQQIPGVNRLATTSITQGTAASRITFTKISIESFFNESDVTTFFFGWGWDNYLFFFQAHYEPSVYLFEGSLIDRGHNKLVDVLIMSGFTGLLTYLAAWFLFFKYTIRLIRKKYFLGLSLFFFLVTYFVHNLFFFDNTATYLAFFATAAFLTYSLSKNVHENIYE